MDSRILACFVFTVSVANALTENSFGNFSLEGMGPEIIGKIKDLEDGEEAFLMLQILQILGEKRSSYQHTEYAAGKPYQWIACIDHRFRELQQKGIWDKIKNVLLTKQADFRKKFGMENLSDEEFQAALKERIKESDAVDATKSDLDRIQRKKT